MLVLFAGQMLHFVQHDKHGRGQCWHAFALAPGGDLRNNVLGGLDDEPVPEVKP